MGVRLHCARRRPAGSLEGMTSTETVETFDSRRDAAAGGELRCRTCGHGAVAYRAPATCPMCQARSWLEVPWGPFTRPRSDVVGPDGRAAS